MIKILVLVEGQTEEKFIKELLTPYFNNKSIYIVPIVISTSRRKNGLKYKGGVVSFGQVKSELLKLLKDSSVNMVTTMIDYYGLDNSFPGIAAKNVPSNLYEKIKFLEKCFSDEIKHKFFYPYYQLHEFETLLFSDQDSFVNVLKKTNEIQDIFRNFINPEELINCYLKVGHSYPYMDKMSKKYASHSYRKNRSVKVKVTRVIKSENLNKGKYDQLSVQAKRLGQVRSEVWHCFGSINGVSIKNDRKIRDSWLKSKRQFKVSANAWKEALRDSFGDIKANRESAKEKVRKILYKQVDDEDKRLELYKGLKSDSWTSNNYLRRLMRKHWKHGHNHTQNQIVVRSDNYTTFQLGGRGWLKIPSLQKGKRITLPLNTTKEPTGTLRLILRDGEVEVHYTIEIAETHNCGSATLGIDKGYTEVFIDSDGEHHGKDLGKLLSEHSDKLKKKYQARNKLKAILTKKPPKKPTIIANNLGRKKLNHQNRKVKSQLTDKICQATHKLVDKAEIIAAEDLTSPIVSKKFGKNVTRRLSAWTKGVIANALDLISRRRGSSVILVNSAYTSQMDSRYGLLLGERKGDSFYCFDGVVLQADENAAQNVLARLHDPEIDRWTPWQQVKSILLKRTERHRLGLLNQDSSCNSQELSTESELPKMSNFV